MLTEKELCFNLVRTHEVENLPCCFNKTVCVFVGLGRNPLTTDVVKKSFHKRLICIPVQNHINTKEGLITEGLMIITQ